MNPSLLSCPLNITTGEHISLLFLAEFINKVGERRSEIKILKEGLGAEYSGDNSRLLKEIVLGVLTAPLVFVMRLLGYKWWDMYIVAKINGVDII